MSFFASEVRVNQLEETELQDAVNLARSALGVAAAAHLNARQEHIREEIKALNDRRAKRTHGVFVDDRKELAYLENSLRVALAAEGLLQQLGVQWVLDPAQDDPNPKTIWDEVGAAQ